jgi:ribosomal protein L16/L10AE
MKFELKQCPKKTKYKKQRRGTLRPIKFYKATRTLYNAWTKNIIVIKAIDTGFLNWKTTNEVVKKLRTTIKLKKKRLKRKKMKLKLRRRKKQRVHIKYNLALNWNASKKNLRVRMGRGKGKVNIGDWYARVASGTEIIQLNIKPKKWFLNKINKKLNILPIFCKCRLI